MLNYSQYYCSPWGQPDIEPYLYWEDVALEMIEQGCTQEELDAYEFHADNDCCSVVAMVGVTGWSYPKAYRYIQLNGRLHGDGMAQFNLLNAIFGLENQKFDGYNLYVTQKCFEVVDTKSGQISEQFMTLGQLMEAIHDPEQTEVPLDGDYVCIVDGHVFAIHHGVVFDDPLNTTMDEEVLELFLITNYMPDDWDGDVEE